MVDAPRSWRRLIQAAPRAELEQSILRVAIPAIAALVLLALWVWNGKLEEGQARGMAIAIAFLVFAGTLTLHIVVRGDATNVRFRRVLGIVADNAVNTYFMLVMDEGGAVVFGVYLFVTFGNGFRYGRLYLHLSQVFSILGFCAVLALSPFWSQHPFVGAGILIALVVLPFYVGVLAQRITEARRKADEANRAKDRFLANVSHEMRTPLNGVIAMADLLRETPLDKRQAELVDTLSTSAQLALRQVEDVLSAAKIEAGRVSVVPAPFDLERLLRDTVKVVLPQATFKNLHVTMEFNSADPKWFVGDSRLIQQVMLNLLSNAVKFTKNGSVALRVNQSERAEHATRLKTVRMEVEDTGIGIPKEKLATIFEAFAQADDSITRTYGGTGLGTTIAQQLIRIMGGTIGVESSPGVGSTFWVEIPLAPCEPTDAERNPVEASAHRGVALSDAPIAFTPARVLVAEDNPTNQRVTELILSSRGHQCTIVSNGEQALDALESEAFDIALVDLSMPILSGLDVLKAYRFLTPNPIPIVMLSANVTTELIDASLAAGAAEFMSKPVRASALLAAIDRHLAVTNSRGSALPQKAVIGSDVSTPRLQVVHSPVLDELVLNEIAQMTSDTTFLKRLLRGFLEDCDRLVKQLSRDLASGDIEAARDAAHALKGGAGGVGAFALMHLVARLEKMSNEDCRQDARALRHEIEICASKTMSAIDVHLGNEARSRPGQHSPEKNSMDEEPTSASSG